MNIFNVSFLIISTKNLYQKHLSPKCYLFFVISPFHLFLLLKNIASVKYELVVLKEVSRLSNITHRIAVCQRYNISFYVINYSRCKYSRSTQSIPQRGIKTKLDFSLPPSVVIMTLRLHVADLPQKTNRLRQASVLIVETKSFTIVIYI